MSTLALRFRDVAIVLPIDDMRAAWRRAEAFDLDRGGRYDPRGASVVLWSRPTAPGDDWGEFVGAFYVLWHEPDERHATVWRLEWVPEQGGSEDEVRRALEVLLGRPLA